MPSDSRLEAITTNPITTNTRYLPATALSQLPLSPVLSMPLRLLTINKVEPLRLNLPVHKGANETSNDLLGLGMVIDLA